MCSSTENDLPKITDFGLAKLLQTESGQTRNRGRHRHAVSYMAPEQAAASKDLGPACDIYSLGAILYELLTGIPPFRGETALATLNMVAEMEPVPPRMLNVKIDADLETICLKCLEKEPHRRYPTALALADDLRHYLNDEPINARRSSTMGRALKWCRRKPTAAALLAVSCAALAALICGLISFSFIQHDAAVKEGKAVEEERRLRIQAEDADKLSADPRKGMGRSTDTCSQIRRAQEMPGKSPHLDRADQAARSLEKVRPARLGVVLS